MIRRRTRQPATIQPNLTSMVDVVFILVVFFMLVSQLSKEQFIEMLLPRLRAATTEPIDADRRVVVNVIPAPASGGGATAPGHAARYRLGAGAFDATPEGVAALARALREATAREPDTRIIIRAARDERYETVHPVLQAVTLAGATRVDLVAMPDDGGAPADPKGGRR